MTGQKQGGLPAPVDFLDVPFTPLDLDAVIAALESRPADAPFTYVITPNADIMVRLHRAWGTLWPVYRGAWFFLNDSRILARLARLAGVVLPATPGADLVAGLLAHLQQGGSGGPETPLTILGGEPEVVARVIARFGLRRVSHHNPPMGFIDDPAAVAACVDFAVAHPARYVLVVLGNPRQEILSARIAATGKATGIGLCCGASLNFLAGTQQRAPAWMRRHGLEWLFRLGQEPGRLWCRYLVDSPLIFLLWLRWMRGRRQKGAR